MIRLFCVPVSSYSAKVRIVLRHKDVAYEDMPPPGGYGSADYRKLVPPGTMPAIDHEGFVLWESEAIAEYLEAVFPTPAMMPQGAKAMAAARAFSRFHDTRLEPPMRALFPHMAPAGRDTDFVAGQIGLVDQRLEQLGEILDAMPFVAGEKLWLCDCGFTIAFAILDTLAEAMAIRFTLPELVISYKTRLQTHDAVARELAAYIPVLADWTRSKVTNS